MSQTLVLMPAFNEQARIAEIITQVRAIDPAWDVLVVDDGSHDDTAREAIRAGAAVVRHPFNLGYGAALQTAYKYAAHHGYRFALQMDADGQHPPEEASKLLAPVCEGQVDMAIGSRFLAGGGGYEVPAARRMGIALFGGLARLLTGVDMSDVTSGFAAVGRRGILLFSGDRFPADYPDADLRIMLHKVGLRVREVPITMRANPAGKSMHGGVLSVWYVIKMLISMFVVWITRFEAPPEEES